MLYLRSGWTWFYLISTPEVTGLSRLLLLIAALNRLIVTIRPVLVAVLLSRVLISIDVMTLRHPFISFIPLILMLLAIHGIWAEMLPVSLIPGGALTSARLCLP